MRHLTCDPKAETLGVNILAYFKNLRDYQTLPIVQQYGLADVKSTDWIPTRNYLNVLNELGKAPDFMSGLVAIGMEIGKIAQIEIENPTLGDVLMVWNDVYQALHRNADVGAIRCEKASEKHYKLTFTDLYPDDFSYGIMYGYARRFLLPGTQFTISYDPKVTPRDRGGKEGHTVIHAQWD